MKIRPDSVGDSAPPPAAFSLRRAAPMAAIALCAVAGLLTLGNFDVVAALGEHREALIAWCQTYRVTAVALYISTFVMVVVLSLPGAFAMTVTGGFLFGLIPGAFLSVLGATTGGVVVFLLARHGLGDALRGWLLSRRSSGLFRRIEQGLHENAVIYLLLLRIVPAVPFTVANVAPAFFGVRTRTFALTTFVGVMPGTTITAWIGAGLGEVFDRGDTPDLSIFADPAIYLPILGLIGLGTLPLLLRRRPAPAPPSSRQ